MTKKRTESVPWNRKALTTADTDAHKRTQNTKQMSKANQ